MDWVVIGLGKKDLCVVRTDNSHGDRQHRTKIEQIYYPGIGNMVWFSPIVNDPGKYFVVKTSEGQIMIYGIVSGTEGYRSFVYQPDSVTDKIPVGHSWSISGHSVTLILFYHEYAERISFKRTAFEIEFVDYQLADIGYFIDNYPDDSDNQFINMVGQRLSKLCVVGDERYSSKSLREATIWDNPKTTNLFYSRTGSRYASLDDDGGLTFFSGSAEKKVKDISKFEVFNIGSKSGKMYFSIVHMNKYRDIAIIDEEGNQRRVLPRESDLGLIQNFYINNSVLFVVRVRYVDRKSLYSLTAYDVNDGIGEQDRIDIFPSSERNLYLPFSSTFDAAYYRSHR